VEETERVDCDDVAVHRAREVSSPLRCTARLHRAVDTDDDASNLHAAIVDVLEGPRQESLVPLAPGDLWPFRRRDARCAIGLRDGGDDGQEDGVLVYDFMPAGFPFERGAQWMQDEAPDVLVAAAEVAFDYSHGAGFLELGSVRDRWDSLVLDVQLSGKPTTAPFAYFQGELELAPLREGRSHLSLSAGYAPRSTSTLTAVERRNVQREIEVRVREFLALVAMQLERFSSKPM